MERIMRAEVIRWDDELYGVALDFDGRRYEAYQVGTRAAALKEVARRKAINDSNRR